MADFAANVAMDTKKSLQVHAPTNRTIARTLHEYVHHDVNYWLETSLSVEVVQTSRRSNLSIYVCGHASCHCSRYFMPTISS